MPAIPDPDRQTCPKCGRTNFTAAGLVRHKCRPPGPGEPLAPAADAHALVVIDGRAVLVPAENEDATTLRSLFAEAQNGMRRIVAVGLFCFEIKSRIPHGQFGNWLRENCPEFAREDSNSLSGGNLKNGVSRGDGKRWKATNALSSYMAITTQALEACGVTVEKFLALCSSQVLLLPDGEITCPQTQALRHKIFALIDGKTKRELTLQFRDPAGRNVSGAPRREHRATPTVEEEIARLQDRCKDAAGTLHYAVEDRCYEVLNDAELDGWIDELEAAAALARKWRDTPKNARRPQTLAPASAAPAAAADATR